jgi:hypothetical protein
MANLEEKLNEAVGRFQALAQRESELASQLNDVSQQKQQAYGAMIALDALFREEFTEQAGKEAAEQAESSDDD